MTRNIDLHRLKFINNTSQNLVIFGSGFFQNWWESQYPVALVLWDQLADQYLLCVVPPDSLLLDAVSHSVQSLEQLRCMGNKNMPNSHQTSLGILMRAGIRMFLDRLYFNRS